MKTVLLIVYFCSEALITLEKQGKDGTYLSVRVDVFSRVFLFSCFCKIFQNKQLKQTTQTMFSTLFILALSFIGSTLATTGVDVSQRTYSNSWGKNLIVFDLIFIFCNFDFLRSSQVV
jgi:hypothetical protein